MKSKKQQNQEKWRQIIKEAERYPGSLAAYCRDKGVSYGSLNLWRSKLQERIPTRNVTPINPFARLEVIDSPSSLPDAKWVAEFIHHLIGASK